MFSGKNHVLRSFSFKGLLVVGLAISCSISWAFDPPVDSDGVVTVRIDGPSLLKSVTSPFKVTVVLQNKGAKRLEGRLQIGLIDGWQAEPEVVEVVVPAGKQSSYVVQIVPAVDSYSAHYPVHVFAQLSDGAKQYRLHPILIIETHLPPPEIAKPHPPWKPFDLSGCDCLALWQMPLRRAIVAVFDRQAKVMPIGWLGTESQTHAVVSVSARTLENGTRDTITMHPPWYKGQVGTVACEFPLVFPKNCSPHLRFYAAVQPEGQSDGVTFRVRALGSEAPAGALGEVVWEKHITARRWTVCEVPLEKLAGKSVRLQLEAHPGPKNNTGWDLCFWGEPVLVLKGLPPEAQFPPQASQGVLELGRFQLGDFAGRYCLKLGRRGVLDGAIGFVAKEHAVWFQGFSVRVAGMQLEQIASPAVLEDVQQTQEGRSVRFRHRFASPWGSFDLLAKFWQEGQALKVKFWLENAPQSRPWHVVYLEDVSCGQWSRPIYQVYAGAGNVVRKPGPFRLTFDGHRLSTSFVGLDFQDAFSLVQAVDLPPDELRVEPRANHCSLHVPHEAVWTFIPAENVWKAVQQYRQVNGLKAAGGVKKAAGRFVFDLWGGYRYREAAELLQQAFAYGLTDAMVIWHNWQRWGYDYRLPDIYPPNPRFGRLEDMQHLIETCRQAGVLFALHDNYIDFYPDAEGFSYLERIAFSGDGRPVRAWFNRGRQAQSYRYRADQVEPFLRRNLRLIKENLNPTAYFIDVWSSIRPYDYWTSNGEFYTRVFTRNTWGEHFAWIRRYLGGDAPQISESGHDQLIGWLDGAQTNHLRVGPPVGEGYYRWAVWNWPCEDAERVPWFDAAHHDRFVLHGAGYSGRYQAGLSFQMHGIYSDDYITTEVLTGHPAMVSQPFGPDVVRKYWLLHDLGRALALRQIEHVEFVDNNLHRQLVRWSGGGQVWVNRGNSPWNVQGVRLPQYGFLARVPTESGLVEAMLVERHGIITEMSVSPQALYVNGRALIEEIARISLAVKQVAYKDQHIIVKGTWDLKTPIPSGYRPFFHFCDQDGEIRFQGGMAGSVLREGSLGTFEAVVVAQVPDSCRPGQKFQLRFGFYDPGTGRRLRLQGPDDGQMRIRLGTVELLGSDGITGVGWQPVEQIDEWLLRQNPDCRPVDFGPVITAGAFRLVPQQGKMLVLPLPGSKGDARQIAIRWSQLPWKLPQPHSARAIGLDGRPLDGVLLQAKNGMYQLTVPDEAFGVILLAE